MILMQPFLEIKQKKRWGIKDITYLRTGVHVEQLIQIIKVFLFLKIFILYWSIVD